MKNLVLALFALLLLSCHFEAGFAMVVQKYQYSVVGTTTIRPIHTTTIHQQVRVFRVSSSPGSQLIDHHSRRSRGGMNDRTMTMTMTNYPHLFRVAAASRRYRTIIPTSVVPLRNLKRKASSILKEEFQQQILLTIPCSYSAIKEWIRNTILIGISRKRVMLFIAFCLMANLLVDTIQTKRRQRIDPTSEWGRYADHPSIRGRALFSLMGRISTMMLWAKIIQLLPGIKAKANANAYATNTVRRAGETFAEGLLRLGPLYIKIGQILSCRKNLLPEEWKTAMERLQDRVPAKSGQEALELAYSSYDGNGINGEEEFCKVFKEFDDEPLAAASLGQVHKATLRSNDKVVAIKLQRPRLRDIYDKDLALMNKIAKAVDKFGGTAGEVGGVKQSWEEIFHDAEDILYREIDYRDEAENAKRFAESFGLGVDGTAIPSTSYSLDGKNLPSAAAWMRTPYVYDEYSTERILVMEYVPSIKISDDAKLTSAGVSSEDKEALAESLARSYLRQFVCGKFFSTDPHAGNLGVIVEQDGNGKKKGIRLVFYDFGQACSLKDDQAAGILNVIEGIMDYDVNKCVDAFIQMGVLADDADLDKVRRKVKDNFETGKIKVKQRKKKRKNQSTQISEVTTDGDRDGINNPNSDNSNANAIVNMDTDETAVHISNSTKVEESDTENEALNDAEIMSYFTLPAEYAFVARAISQMDGVGKNLDADFDFISAAAPWIVEIKGGERYLQDEFQKVVRKALQFQSDVFKAAGFRSSK